MKQPAQSAAHYYMKHLKAGAPGYDKKYEKGKNMYLDIVYDWSIRFSSRKVNVWQPKVLEIGTFTGRITRKLANYFNDITISEVEPENLEVKGFKKIQIDLSKVILVNQKFDLVMSLGHQVSFSNNVNLGIKNISSLCKINGLVIFDIWNSNEEIFSDYNLEYRIDRATRKEVIKYCQHYNIKILKILYGPRINRVLGGVIGKVISKYGLRNNFLGRMYVLIETVFRTWKLKILDKNTQTIIIIGRKIE